MIVSLSKLCQATATAVLGHRHVQWQPGIEDLLKALLKAAAQGPVGLVWCCRLGTYRGTRGLSGNLQGFEAEVLVSKGGGFGPRGACPVL
jgi:hypothetical protein